MNQLELILRSDSEVAQRVEETASQLRAYAEGRPAALHQGKALPNFIPFGEGALRSELEGFDPRFAAEAIILSEMRPAWLIRDDRIEVLGDYDRLDLVEKNRSALEAQARKVGRIDLLNHRSLNFAGTGWLIAEDIACTNRHVAEVFARSDWLGEWDFASDRFDDELRAEVSFLRQHATRERAERRAVITEILFVSERNELDIAFVRVTPTGPVEPLEPYTEPIRDELPCAVVGYPAWDGHRNDQVLMDQIFGGIYDVKRFAPGKAFADEDRDGVITADYSSLGGNSGSAVVELNTGKVLGLHFAGAFREANYAVAADMVWSALAAHKTHISVSANQPGDPETPLSELETRPGYQADFLGSDMPEVALPGLGSHREDVAPVAGTDDHVLRYQHFSVVQHAQRRLPLFTAVNIDGALARTLKREGSWRLDPRIAREHQIGNELYRRNPLDRGHLVRRKDPGWGDLEYARKAERDTFHYTNCAPQHEDLNQKSWVALEDYILESASTHGFKASVFTGPVLRDDDRVLRDRDGVPIPREFWKIAVMVNAQSGALSASGYILSHGRMIRSITETGFVYGRYQTYQLPIALIAQETGLELDQFIALDSFASQTLEGGTTSPHPINGPEDLVL